MRWAGSSRIVGNFLRAAAFADALSLVTKNLAIIYIDDILRNILIEQMYVEKI